MSVIYELCYNILNKISKIFPWKTIIFDSDVMVFRLSPNFALKPGNLISWRKVRKIWTFNAKI